MHSAHRKPLACRRCRAKCSLAIPLAPTTTFSGALEAVLKSGATVTMVVIVVVSKTVEMAVATPPDAGALLAVGEGVALPTGDDELPVRTAKPPPNPP